MTTPLKYKLVFGYREQGEGLPVPDLQQIKIDLSDLPMSQEQIDAIVGVPRPTHPSDDAPNEIKEKYIHDIQKWADARQPVVEVCLAVGHIVGRWLAKQLLKDADLSPSGIAESIQGKP